jgi:hypothetical protein
MKLLNKTLCVTALATVSSIASASSIWIDTGTNYTTNGSPLTATHNALEVVVNEATSTLIGGICDGATPSICTPTVGSTFTESGSGFISALLPISNPQLDNNGLGQTNGWGLSFEYSGITGSFSGPGGIPIFDAGGLVDVFFIDNVTQKREQMARFVIDGGGPLLGESSMYGTADYSWSDTATDKNETAADAETFFNSVNPLGGEHSFYNIWNDWKDQTENPLEWLFEFGIAGNNNTPFEEVGNTGEGSRVTSLYGPLSFSVPEPTSIAIMGLSLLGFAASRKRKLKS